MIETCVYVEGSESNQTMDFSLNALRSIQWLLLSVKVTRNETFETSCLRMESKLDVALTRFIPV